MTTRATGEPPRLIGRDAEQRALSAFLDRVAQGHGGVVVLSGEPGIGKTELAEHLATEAAERGFLVARGRCREWAEAPPFWPWRSVIRAVPGVAWPDAGEPGESRFGLYVRLADLLLTASAASPVLVFLDDVHAADGASVDLLGFLAAQLFPADVGILVTTRDPAAAERAPAALAPLLSDLAASRDGMRLDLGPLSVSDVRDWIERDHVVDVDAREIHDRTGGNPLFVREVLRLGDARPGALPDAVRDVIRTRVGRLPEPSRQLLGAAAVVGRDFTVPVLAAMLASGPETVESRLAPAVAARLIGRPRGDEPGRYRFAHVLTQETVASDLDPGERNGWHARAFAVLPYVGLTEPADLAVHAVAASGQLDAAAVVRATRRRPRTPTPGSRGRPPSGGGDRAWTPSCAQGATPRRSTAPGWHWGSLNCDPGTSSRRGTRWSP